MVKFFSRADATPQEHCRPQRKEFIFAALDKGFYASHVIHTKAAAGKSAVQIYPRCANRSGTGVLSACIAQRIGNSGKQHGRRFPYMLTVKDTLRATVNLAFDGRVFKTYHGADAQTRFDNEVRVLRHLEARGCNFVPRLLEADAEKLRIITTNCGTRVDHLDEKRMQELFAELRPFGVRHDDVEMRNVAYRQSDGRFCLIDFEFATILPETQTKPK